MVFPRKRRAQAKSAYDDNDDEEESHDVAYEDEDEDDDDEDDFVPEDDEDEEDSGGDGDESAKGVLEGHLYFDEEEEVLHYQGDSFHLSTHVNGNDAKEGEESKSPSVWNPLRDPPPSSNTATYRMQGTIQPPGFSNEGDDDKATSKFPLRLFDVTWTITHDGEPLPGHHNEASCPSKETCISQDADIGDGEEEDGKQKASPKRPALFYRIVGREMVNATENVLIQFQGGFYPLPAGKSDGKAISKTTNSVPLNCQFQYALSETNSTVAAAAAAAPVVAVASSAAASAPDDDDDDDEADEGMGYDELIALHEDAGMDVEALKRRYQHTKNSSNDDADNDDDGKPTPKKFKGAPKSDDDDDDDVGF
jgi:hypothetical protein